MLKGKLGVVHTRTGIGWRLPSDLLRPGRASQVPMAAELAGIVNLTLK